MRRLLAALFVITLARTARADAAIANVEVTGLGRTERATILELFPRRAPATFTDAELKELERRVRNLELFDDVAIVTDGTTLRITVREKFSISPIVSFSTGKTLRDTSATLGAVENNIGGRGTRLGAYAEYSERAPQFGVWITEHSYHPRNWQKEAGASYEASDLRFDGTSSTWLRTRLGGFLEGKTPFSYAQRSLRYEIAVSFYRERLIRAEGAGVPDDGYYVGTLSELIWDHYSWNDLVPHGFRVTTELRPGAFLGPAEPRFEAKVHALAAVPLGPRTVLAMNAVGNAVNSGNVNHSVLLGSQEGVRGLADTFYRDQAHAFANIELRHAFQLARRWFLQPVVFADGAGFLPLKADGTPDKWLGALSAGAGLRLIPTALVRTLLRVDGSRLLAGPSRDWFVQLGIDQYF